MLVLMVLEFLVIVVLLVGIWGLWKSYERQSEAVNVILYGVYSLASMRDSEKSLRARLDQLVSAYMHSVKPPPTMRDMNRFLDVVCSYDPEAEEKNV